MKDINSLNISEVRRNFAVSNSFGLFLVRDGGYAASAAWLQSDEAYAQICGSKFGGFFQDTCKEEHISKYNVRAVADMEEFYTLWNKANDLWKEVVIRILSGMSFCLDPMVSAFSKNFGGKYAIERWGWIGKVEDFPGLICQITTAVVTRKTDSIYEYLKTENILVNSKERAEELIKLYATYRDGDFVSSSCADKAIQEFNKKNSAFFVCFNLHD